MTNLILLVNKALWETNFYFFYFTLEKSKCCNNTMQSKNTPCEPKENDNLQSSNPEV